MAEPIRIQPTYYAAVEAALYDAGQLDLFVEFTKSDPRGDDPRFITEVSVKEGHGPEIEQSVRDALTPFIS